MGDACITHPLPQTVGQTSRNPTLVQSVRYQAAPAENSIKILPSIHEVRHHIRHHEYTDRVKPYPQHGPQIHHAETSKDRTQSLAVAVRQGLSRDRIDWFTRDDIKDATRERYQFKGLEPFRQYLLQKGRSLYNLFDCDPYLRLRDGSNVDDDTSALILADYFCYLWESNLNPKTYSQALQYYWRQDSRSIAPFRSHIVGAVIGSRSAADKRNAGRRKVANATEPATTEMAFKLIHHFFNPSTMLYALTNGHPRLLDQAAATCIAVTLFLFGMLRLSNQTTQVPNKKATARAQHRADLGARVGITVNIEALADELRQDNAILVRDVVFGKMAPHDITGSSGLPTRSDIHWFCPLELLQSSQQGYNLWYTSPEDITSTDLLNRSGIRYVGILSPCTKQHAEGDRPIRLLIDTEQHPLHAHVVRMFVTWAILANFGSANDLFWSRLYSRKVNPVGPAGLRHRYPIPACVISAINKYVFSLCNKNTDNARPNSWKYGGATLLALGQTLHNNNTVTNDPTADRERARVALNHSSSSSTGHYINNIQGGLGTLPRTDDPEQQSRDDTRCTLSSTMFRQAFASSSPNQPNNSSSERSDSDTHKRRRL